MSHSGEGTVHAMIVEIQSACDVIFPETSHMAELAFGSASEVCDVHALRGIVFTRYRQKSGDACEGVS